MQRRFSVPPLPAAPEPVPVLLMGLGSIGLEMARLALSKRSLRVVGAVDPDPRKAGQDLSALLDLPQPTGIQVAATLPAETAARLVLHSTLSFFPDVRGQLAELVDRGWNVVSSSEELSYPFLKYPQEAAELDARAKARGVRVLGTGVNPGFVMDTWPLVMTGLAQETRHVRVERVVDASHRRYNLQKKIGAGMSVAEFEEAMAGGRMGHVGLVESVALIAAGLGWPLERIDEEIGPVVAETATGSDFFDLAPGQVAGLRQTAVGIRGGEEAIALHLEMALGAQNPRDRVILDGRPALDVTVAGGVHGDAATAAVLVNSAPRLLVTEPGLRTMLDLPLVRTVG